MVALLELHKMTKEYWGTPVLQDVDFTLEKGEIHALVGENGAGKSTLTKIIAGVIEQTHGEMRIENQIITFSSPAEAIHHGIVMVFQETSLVPSMTVAQNLFLGEEKFFNRLRGVYIAAQQFLQSLNFNVDPWATVAALGAAKRQMVEIARAVRRNARIIIFDEPTAALTPEEKRHFFNLMSRLKLSGVSVIFISHALEEALTASDRITVLRDGKLVVTDDTKTFDRERIIRAMVGRDLTDRLYSGTRPARPPGRKVLSVQNLSMGKVVRNNSFSVYRGQITGMFGLIGSGRTETAKVISGVLKRNYLHGGEIRLNGRLVRYRVPKSAVRDGVVYVTEDRKVEGFFETMSISENIGIGLLATRADKLTVFRFSELQQFVDQWAQSLQIRAASGNAKVIELSGGNQQKVVIASALVQKPTLVIFDEPTRGVDVGAIAEIHALIDRLADEGLAVIVISSYLPEVMMLSDRILVSRAGRIVEEFSRKQATAEKIMFAAVH